MPDAKALDLAKRELDELISTGEKLMSVAGNAKSQLQGRELSDIMAWVASAGHIIRKVDGADSTYDRAFQAARSAPGFTIVHSNHYGHCVRSAGLSKGCATLLTSAYCRT